MLRNSLLLARRVVTAKFTCLPRNNLQPVRNVSFTPILRQNDSDHPLRDDLDDSTFHGVAQEPFSPEIAKVLMNPVNPEDVELLPDGIPYLPEIKYRRILNRAFGPGGWALVPRGKHTVSEKTLSREYALYCLGRFVSQARGEQDFFNKDGLATATEGVKSNALMRCCKDLGIASELWDPQWTKKFKEEYCVEVWATNVKTNSKTKIWRRKDVTLSWPMEELGEVRPRVERVEKVEKAEAPSGGLKIGLGKK